MITMAVEYDSASSKPMERVDYEISMFSRREAKETSFDMADRRRGLIFEFKDSELDFALLAHDEIISHMDNRLRVGVTVDVEPGK